MNFKTMRLDKQLNYCNNKTECKLLIESMKGRGLSLIGVCSVNGDDGLSFCDEDGNVLLLNVIWLDDEEAERTIKELIE